MFLFNYTHLIPTSARSMKNSAIAENITAIISVCKFLYRGADCELLQRCKTIRNRLMSKALNVHKTAADLEDQGKWLSWPLFLEAISSLQSELNLTLSPKASRLQRTHECMTVTCVCCAFIRQVRLDQAKCAIWNTTILRRLTMANQRVKMGVREAQEHLDASRSQLLVSQCL